MKNKLFPIGIIMLILWSNGLNAQQTTIKNSADTLQYAAGAYIGQWLKTNGIKITNYGVLRRGINDILAGKLLVKDSLLNAKLSQQIKNNQITAAKNQEQQLFATLKNKKGVGFLPSGIAYMIDSTGMGARPNAKDSIEMEIRGFLPDGQLFTDTYQSRQTLKTNISNLIPGLAEGIQLMPAGSKWRIFVPAALAYGSAGLSGLIPPYTALIFQVELKKVIRK